MTGAIVGLTFGIGALVVLSARAGRARRPARSRRRVDRRFWAAVAACAAPVFLVVAAVSGSPVIAAAFA
ncbi:MAG: hypothetical protein JO074_03955, partial [Frankiales bacterium]|nr:hypothetical protein [Frankiales bacterium]